MSVKPYRKVQRINVRNQRVEEMVQQRPDGGSESRLSMIQMLIPLGLRAVEEELQAEVIGYVGGGRNACTDGAIKRWGKNPGSVYLGDQKVKINVPRVRNLQEHSEVLLVIGHLRMWEVINLVCGRINGRVVDASISVRHPLIGDR